SSAIWEWIYYTHFSSKDDHFSKDDFEKLWTGEIKPCIQHGKVLVLIDGYDELPAQHPYLKALKDLVEGKTYPGMTIIITSRPYGIATLPPQRRNIEVIGFTDENIERYIKTYFDQQLSSVEEKSTSTNSNTAISQAQPQV